MNKTGVEIRDRITELRRIRASELIPNPKNWREHPQGQREAIEEILAKIGYADALYRWQHEPLWYAVRKGKSAGWCGGHDQTTVWPLHNLNSIGGRSKDEADKKTTGHGTQKPVECMARPMRNHDAPEIYDPFLGSGTTLIAAEQLNRRCYGLEIEPRYCDVIVERWQNLTGKKAKLESRGTEPKRKNQLRS